MSSSITLNMKKRCNLFIYSERSSKMFELNCVSKSLIVVKKWIFFEHLIFLASRSNLLCYRSCFRIWLRVCCLWNITSIKSFNADLILGRRWIHRRKWNRHNQHIIERLETNPYQHIYNQQPFLLEHGRTSEYDQYRDCIRWCGYSQSYWTVCGKS